jgi:hypothetical protein
VVAGIAEDRAGTDWVVHWLVANCDYYEGIVVQSNGAPVTSLCNDIENALVEAAASVWAAFSHEPMPATSDTAAANISGAAITNDIRAS